MVSSDASPARARLAAARRSVFPGGVRPLRSLRVRLALIYAALFCVSAVALGAVAEVFKPNFLVHSSAKADPNAPQPSASVCCHISSPSLFATVGHDARQNVAGVVLVVVMGLLSVGVGWLLAGRVLRPLRAIISSTRTISASNLNQRLDLDRPTDEFAELGETLDDLLGRLEASFEAQRRFVANASHELRTPLAAGRTVLQVALADPAVGTQTLRAACQEVLNLGEQQERLIDGLLTLASSERGIDRWERFDLASIASKAAQDREQEAERQGVRVETALAAAPATGDPHLVACLVANLVDNALRYNVPDGLVRIATTVAEGRTVLSVGNTGPVIQPGDVDRLFQPFQRLGSDRIQHTGGHGLGLAIVRAIAETHGATLTATARPHGGLDIEASFPGSGPGAGGTGE
jgi:signal transduction histidine kinase